MVSHLYMMFWLDSRTDGSLAENGGGGRTLSFVKAHNGFSLYPALSCSVLHFAEIKDISENYREMFRLVHYRRM